MKSPRSVTIEIERHEHGIVLRCSEIPAQEYVALLRAWAAEGWDILAPGIAHALHAHTAVTKAELLERWNAEIEAAAAARAGDDRERAWLDGPDTGLSSMTIFSVLSKRWGRVAFEALRSAGWLPADPDDFGRCLRLLEAIPEWRGRLAEVAVAYPEWGPLVRAWDEFEGLYRTELGGGHEGQAPRLYARMRELYRTELGSRA